MNKPDSTKSAKPMPAIAASSDSDPGGPAIEAVEAVASIAVGSKLQVSAAKLEPFLDHHSLSPSKDMLTVEVVGMGMGSTDVNSKKAIFIVMEIKLVDNQD